MFFPVNCNKLLYILLYTIVYDSNDSMPISQNHFTIWKWKSRLASAQIPLVRAFYQWYAFYGTVPNFYFNNCINHSDDFYGPRIKRSNYGH